MVGPEPEVEGPLKPHGLGVLPGQPRVVAGQRLACLLPKQALALAVAEASASPARLEQLEHLLERRAAFGVVALEHLVDCDPEALVECLLGRDAQHSRELVSERAASVGLDVRRRQRQADSLARQEWPERGLAAWCDRLRSRAIVLLGPNAARAGDQRVIQRGGLKDL